MKTSKKLFSILLAVLMFMGCFGAAFPAFAWGPAITSVDITTRYFPYAGKEFPTEADYSVKINGGSDAMEPGMVVVNEWVNGEGQETEAPFVLGKPYVIWFIFSFIDDQTYAFSEQAPAVTLNGESITPIYQYVQQGLAAIGYSFTARNPILTVVADPAEGGTVTGGGSYPYGSEVAFSAMPKDGYYFNGWYDGEKAFSSFPAAVIDKLEKDRILTAEFVKKTPVDLTGFIKMKIYPDDAVQVNEWYFDDLQLALEVLKALSIFSIDMGQTEGDPSELTLDMFTEEQKQELLKVVADLGILPDEVWYNAGTDAICIKMISSDDKIFTKDSTDEEIKSWYKFYHSYIKYKQPDQTTPDNPDNPGGNDQPATTNPDNGGNNAPAKGDCKYCGGTHTGFVGFFVKIFHSILALFGLRK